MDCSDIVDEDINSNSDWLEDEIFRSLLETIADLKIWHHKQNPKTPLRHIVLNRNLYNRLVQSAYL
jgi:hypothetical protein